MSTIDAFVGDFLGQLAAYGVTAQRANVRETPDGGRVLFGGSPLEVFVRPWPHGADADATDGERWPFAFGGPYPAEFAGRVRHRSLRRGHVHADLYEGASEDGSERTLDLHATVESGGAWYGLRAFSNSCDFAKVLGRELPSGFTWEKLYAAFERFAGTPPLERWDVDETV